MDPARTLKRGAQSPFRRKAISSLWGPFLKYHPNLDRTPYTPNFSGKRCPDFGERLHSHRGKTAFGGMKSDRDKFSGEEKSGQVLSSNYSRLSGPRRRLLLWKQGIPRSSSILRLIPGIGTTSQRTRTAAEGTWECTRRRFHMTYIVICYR